MQQKNRFFEYSKQEQLRFQSKVGFLSAVVVLLIGLLLFLVNIKLLLILPAVLAIVLSIIAPFFDVPSMVKADKLKYYSLFLLAEKERNGTLKVHGGNLFDYYFVFDRSLNAQERKRLVILEYLRGLSSLIKYENDELLIEGTSYIINERTVRKIGLNKRPLNGIQYLILSFNYFNLLITASLAGKSLELPDLRKVISFRGKVSDLKKSEPFIQELIARLEKKTK